MREPRDGHTAPRPEWSRHAKALYKEELERRELRIRLAWRKRLRAILLALLVIVAVAWVLVKYVI